MSPALAIGIAAGVAELVQRGIVAANQAKETEAILLRNMKPTPSSSEVDEYWAAQAGKVDVRSPELLRDEDVEDDVDDGDRR